MSDSSRSSEDNEFSCVVCYELALDPHGCVSPACGRIVCGKCAKKKAIKDKCPICREEETIKPSASLKRLIGM